MAVDAQDGLPYIRRMVFDIGNKFAKFTGNGVADGVGKIYGGGAGRRAVLIALPAAFPTSFNSNMCMVCLSDICRRSFGDILAQLIVDAIH
jgi:hypothetical protein